MRRLKNAAMRCRSTLRILIFSVISLSYGLSNFREFVPLGYSKATGLNYVLDYYRIDKKDAYAFGDSNNDLPMLTALTNSVAMGNASPATLFDKVSYVTKCASEDGIRLALEHFGFI